MYKNVLKNKILLIPVVVIILVSVVSQDAYAWSGRGGRHHWRGGRSWNNDGFWFGAGVTALAIGAVAAALPPRYTVIYSGGVPYYYDDEVYYRSCSSGYMVVSAPVIAPTVVYTHVPVYTQPVVVAPPASTANQGESFTVNVPNYRGGYTQVMLMRSGTGYVGPQGEFYSEFPKIKQLQEMYGK